MNYTTNYQLTQWEKDDRIQMEDFNDNNAKLDAAIKTNADAIAALGTSKANSASVNAALAQKADASALTAETQARQNADAALQSAVNAMPRIAIGSYVGNGQYGTNKPVSLSFSFSPKLVLVMANDANFTINEDVANYVIFLRGVTSFCGCRASNETNSAGYTVQWGDKTVSWRAVNSSCCPEGQLNVSGKTYHYLAIG